MKFFPGFFLWLVGTIFFIWVVNQQSACLARNVSWRVCYDPEIQVVVYSLGIVLLIIAFKVYVSS
jgi:hypothetical protein